MHPLALHIGPGRAPAVQRGGVSTKLTPISSSTVSALCSMIWSASSFRISKFGMLRWM
jgi:hypothetical protein